MKICVFCSANQQIDPDFFTMTEQKGEVLSILEYAFDYLDDYDILDYFKSHYNVQFQEYISWVCRPMGEKVIKNDIN